MADIQKLTYPYFADGTTQLNAANLNPIIAKMNEVIDKINGGVTPTQTVATPTISINDTTATISCSTSGATIRYTTNGSTPTHSVGTTISSGSSFSIPSGTTVIKAIAYKDGMNDSSVASQSYSPTDSVQIIVDKIKAKLSGVGNKETAVYNLINALGASTPSTGIWNKIKALYIPCLAITTDANNVFYDVKADEVQTANATESYKIEAKRGVMPTTVGGALGQVTLSGITADNTSMFAIVTQRTEQTLGSSASFVAVGNGVSLIWKANGSCVCLNPNDTNKIQTGAIADFASSPETFVVSAVGSGSRTFITNEGTETGNVEFTATEKYKLAGTSYAAMSLFALADGLTASEAVTVSNALKAFVTAYGIECSNS